MTQTQNLNEKIISLHKNLDDQIGHFSINQFLILFSIFLMELVVGMNGSLPVFAMATPEFRCGTCFDSEKYFVIDESEIEKNFIEGSCYVDSGVGLGNSSSLACCSEEASKDTCFDDVREFMLVGGYKCTYYACHVDTIPLIA